MQPVSIVMRDIEDSLALKEHILHKAEKLSDHYDHINRVRVVIDVPQKHKRQGKLFNVRIDLTVPGQELVVNKKLDEDVYIAVRDAFAAALRQLEDYARKRRGHVKHHESVNAGYVSKLFIDGGFGFIQSMDGNEYYFDREELDQLQVGDTVHFQSFVGDEGFRAHHVHRDKNHHTFDD